MMVFERNRKQPPLIGTCDIPAYCLSKIGGRHFLVGGGGGAAKTGVKNIIETHLLTNENARPDIGLRGECIDKLDTGLSSTMNMDVASIDSDETVAKYLIVAGHDEYCDLYKTNGFKVNEDTGNNLGFNMTHLKRVKTNFSANDKGDSYQRCVRFEKSSRGRIFATGGIDGHIRIWNAQEIIQNDAVTPIVDIDTQKEVADLDFSYNSLCVISVAHNGDTCIWDARNGNKLLDLQYPMELSKGFKTRSVRCTRLGDASNTTVFVATYNTISISSRDQACYVALWGFSQEKNVARPFVVRLLAKQEGISCLTVSDCGNFTSIGTMKGGVAVLDTHDLKQLLFNPADGMFITGMQFLDKESQNISEDKTIAPKGPGASAGYLTSVVSVSGENQILLHRVPFPQSTPPFSLFILFLSFFSLFLCYFLSLLP